MLLLSVGKFGPCKLVSFSLKVKGVRSLLQWVYWQFVHVQQVCMHFSALNLQQVNKSIQ
jgi:hypothetical protein